jgi:ADP-heptose:LPS heptosyltransferase
MIKQFVFYKLKPKLAKLVELMLLVIFSSTAKFRRCKSKSDSILISRTDGFGDFILWLNAAKKIKERYKDKKIVLMLDATKPTAAIAKKLPYFDEVIEIDIHKYPRFLAIFKLAHMQFDMVIQPVYSRLAFTDIYNFAVRANTRITIDSNGEWLAPFEWKVSNYGYDVIVPADKNVRHELIRVAELMRGIGFNDFVAQIPQIDILESATDFNFDYFVCFPVSSSKSKCWEAEKFAETISYIIKRTGLTCLICGSKADKAMCDEVSNLTKKLTSSHELIQNIAGKYNICKTTEIIRNAKMALGNDTGCMHTATVCGIFSVVIVGEFEIGRFFPYEIERQGEQKHNLVVVEGNLPCKGCYLQGGHNPSCKITQNYDEPLPCIKNISAQQVIEVINQHDFINNMS